MNTNDRLSESFRNLTESFGERLTELFREKECYIRILCAYNNYIATQKDNKGFIYNFNSRQDIIELLKRGTITTEDVVTLGNQLKEQNEHFFFADNAVCEIVTMKQITNIISDYQNELAEYILKNADKYFSLYKYILKINYI